MQDSRITKAEVASVIANVDWRSVGISAVASGIAGGAGAGVGIAMSGVIPTYLLLRRIAEAAANF